MIVRSRLPLSVSASRDCLWKGRVIGEMPRIPTSHHIFRTNRSTRHGQFMTAPVAASTPSLSFLLLPMVLFVEIALVMGGF